jgi:cell division septation protein DedD
VYRPRSPDKTVLYEVVRDQLETFLARAREADRVVPRFVERELRRYLECGILAHGFLRVYCDACRHDRLVPFSCKGRGFCPSCGGRRMAETAAFLVDHVIPRVSVRQWVLSVPIPLRYRMAYDAELTTRVLEVFTRAVFASYRRRAKRGRDVQAPRCGAVTFVQRFGDALNVNVHFHTLVLDGVYEGDAASPAAPRFVALPPPNDDEVARVTRKTLRGLRRLLERRGLTPDADPATADPLVAEQPLLAELASASVRSRIAMGPRAGGRVLRIGACLELEAEPVIAGRRCASQSGVSIHANVALPARARQKIERLCRYAARPALATERLSRLDDARLLYRLKRRWRDGTTAILFEPIELVEKLAALVPPPRFHMVRYHGVLAPRARHRDRITPSPRPIPTAARAPTPPIHPTTPPAGSPYRPSSSAASPPGQAPRMEAAQPLTAAPGAQHRPDAPADRVIPRPRKRLTWPELMQRVFSIDVLRCPECGSSMRIIAEIHPPDTTRAILECLGLPIRAPPLAPPEPDSEGFQSAFDPL